MFRQGVCVWGGETSFFVFHEVRIRVSKTFVLHIAV